MAPQPRIEDLFNDECIVPVHDPASQPRTAAGRILQKHFPKLMPRISLRPVRSTESESTAATTRETRSSSRQLSGPHTQDQEGNVDDGRGHVATVPSQLAFTGQNITSNYRSRRSGARVVPEKVGARDFKLRLFFWKRTQTQQAGPVPNGSSIHHMGGTTISGTQEPPTIVVVGAENLPMTTGTNHVDTVLTTTEPHLTNINGTITPVPSECSPETPVHHHHHQHSAIDQAQALAAPSVDKTRANAGRHNLHDAEKEAYTVHESVNSTKLYSPEKGVYVGKLKDLPPPERLREEWRMMIKPELVKNLRMVIASLPEALSVPETRIEPEFYMSGISIRGRHMVSLNPTIWLRCGSERCRKDVQRAVADLSHVLQHRVHVTLQPPRLSSSDIQAPLSLSRKIGSSSSDMADQILSVEPTQPEFTKSINLESLIIRVGSLQENNRSACGLQILLFDSDGTKRTCTLGGILMLNDTVLGLTTAHGLHDFEGTISESSHGGIKHEDGRRSGAEADTTYASLVPATVWAAHFGKYLYASGVATAKLIYSGDATCQDFALLKLHPEQTEQARNAYHTAHGHENVDMTSGDMSARVVQLVCSATDVRSGYLLDGDCVFLDKAGYWETRKIQLDAHLGKFP